MACSGNNAGEAPRLSEVMAPTAAGGPSLTGAGAERAAIKSAKSVSRRGSGAGR
jgi:hypothetical protein